MNIPRSSMPDEGQTFRRFPGQLMNPTGKKTQREEMVLRFSRQVAILPRQNRIGTTPLAFRTNRQKRMKPQADETKKLKLLLQIIPELTNIHAYVGMQEQSWQ
jgi:hypothetical protein